MTHESCSFDLNAQQQRVAIAVGVRRNYAQAIAGTLAFGPELIASSAVERHVTVLQRAIQSLAIHETYHQDFTIGRILDYCGKQSAHLFEIKFCVHCIFPLENLGKNKKPAERFAPAGRES
jgi:hypothetical protein